MRARAKVDHERIDEVLPSPQDALLYRPGPLALFEAHGRASRARQKFPVQISAWNRKRSDFRDKHKGETND
jgi:hypothetical protein